MTDIVQAAPDFVRIPLGTGRFVLLDTEDYERFGHLRIVPERDGYVGYRWGERGHAYLHRLVMNAPKGMQVDHINGDPLDNRKSNLRLCTPSQNQHNKGAIGGSSRFKGVCFVRRDGTWQAAIKLERKSIYLGRFVTEIEAAAAYNIAAVRLHGEFAYLNEIDGCVEACRKLKTA